MDGRIAKALGKWGMGAVLIALITPGWFKAADDERPIGVALFYQRTCWSKECSFEKLSRGVGWGSSLGKVGLITLGLGLLAVLLMGVVLAARKPSRLAAQLGAATATSAGLMGTLFIALVPYAELHQPHMSYSFPVFLLGAFALFLAQTMLMPAAELVGEHEPVPDISP